MADRFLNDPDLSLSELMARCPGTIPIFLRHKMLCVGCLVSPFHTIDDACLEYDLDMDQFIAELRTAISLH